MNTLFVIGKVGRKRCYLNLEEDEAIKRYNKEMDTEVERDLVERIDFVDEFRAYDVWSKNLG